MKEELKRKNNLNAQTNDVVFCACMLPSQHEISVWVMTCE